MLAGHRHPHPWLPHRRSRRPIVPRRKVGALGLRGGDWSSPAFPGEGIVVVTVVRAVGAGGGAAARDCLGVAALGAGGVLASVSRASMMKRTVGAGWVFQAASGRCVSKSVAVGALGVAVSLRRFLDLELL